MVTDGTRMIYYHLPMCEIFYHARFINLQISAGMNSHTPTICESMTIYLFVEWAEISASAVIGAFSIFTKSIPCTWSENPLIFHIVHTYRNT